MLPPLYADADVFMFPTIEDGFGMVLAQAAAAGLVILATRHCAAPEILARGAQGWVLPIRRPEAFVEQLRWCHEHRETLAVLLEAAAATGRPRTWTDVAAEFACEVDRWATSARRGRGPVK